MHKKQGSIITEDRLNKLMFNRETFFCAGLIIYLIVYICKRFIILLCLKNKKK
jgi:hypothetical protein